MEKKFCKFCGGEVEKEAVVCSKCGRQLKIVSNKKVEEVKEEEVKKSTDFYKKEWFMWLMLFIFAPVGIFLMFKFNEKLSKKIKIILSIIFGILFIIIVASSGGEDTEKENNKYETNKKVSVEVIDFNNLSNTEINEWCENNKINCQITEEYSKTIEKGNFISQSKEVSKTIYQGDTIKIIYSLGKEPSTEYKNALKKAESYSKTMNMSKQGIYDQLTSEYGEKFPADAAQYAVDNMTADWNANALAKAKSYQKTMNMSKSAIYDQLISQYGEKFTKSEAQYAIDNLDN